jgi:5'-nucleotidase
MNDFTPPRPMPAMPQFSIALAVFVLALGCAPKRPESVAARRDDTPAIRQLPEPVATSKACGEHVEEQGPEARERARHVVRWTKPGQHGPTLAKIKVLGFNDFHGQLEARKVDSRPAGGAAVLGAYLKDAANRALDGALIVHAGDQVGASPPASALLKDEPSIEFLNLLANSHCSTAKNDEPKCNVVGTLGNHEFDEGKDEMLRLIYGGNHASGPFLTAHYGGAKFGYVCANVVDSKTEEPILPPYTIRQVGQAQVGIVGAVLKSTPMVVTPTGVAGLSFLDETEAINRYVRVLKHKGVDAIGVSIHEGGRQTSCDSPTAATGAVSGDILPILAGLDSAVDFVISGHTHTFTNALLENEEGHPILVTQAFSASTAFEEVDLTIDLQAHEVIEKSASVITTYGDVEPGTSVDPKIRALVEAVEDKTAPLVNRLIGTSATELTRAENAAGESALGNLITDSQRFATRADVACTNPGGIRADLNAGPVTWGELFNIQPFGNSLVAMDLTGAQILELLRQQWVGQTLPRMLKCSGLNYTWDATVPAEGARIVSASVGGAPLDPARVYRVTVNSFMAAGGDNFTVLVQGTHRVNGCVELDALIAYLKTLAEPFTAAIEGRIQLVL